MKRVLKSLAVILCVAPVCLPCACKTTEEEKGFRFTVATNGDGLAVSGIGGYDGTEIVIPSTWENLPITEIYGGAFQGETFTKVTVPDSIKTIGDGAFSNCTNLTEIVGGLCITEIGGYAFQNCVSLKGYVVASSVIKLGREAFKGCTGLSYVYFGNADGWTSNGKAIPLDNETPQTNLSLLSSTEYALCEWQRNPN